MGWTAYSKPHIEHLSDLKRMLQSSPGREYAMGKAPQGFKEYWVPFFEELYVVACLMYLEKVFQKDKNWQSSTNISAQSPYPFLYRKLEVLRCIRNCIVHHGGNLSTLGATQVQVITDFDADVRAGRIREEFNKVGDTSPPFYSIEPTGRVLITHDSQVRWITVQYLMVESVVDVTP